VAYSPDGKALAAAHGWWVTLWDRERRTIRAIFEPAHWCTDVAFSPNGRLLAVMGHDKDLDILSVARGKKVATLTGHSGQVHAVAFRADGKALASASADRTLKLWDLAGGKELTTFRGHTGEVFSVAFSLDGSRLASAGMDRTVKLWDPTSARCLATVEHGCVPHAVAFSPDGRLLASASGVWDGVNQHSSVGEVRLWHVSTGKPYATLRTRATGCWVNALAFSPDGRTLATAAHGSAPEDPGELLLVEVASGKVRAVLTGHPGRVASVAFSPDGRTLVSGGYARSVEQTIKLWDVATGNPRARSPFGKRP
jgi:WD40 repeat protein